MEIWQVTGLVVTVAAAAVVVGNMVRDYFDPYSYRKLSQTVRAMAHEQVRTALRLLEVESLLGEFEFGADWLIAFIERNHLVPPWRPTRRLKQIRNGGSRLLPLYDLLYDHFNDDELFDLAFRVGIRRGEIAGGSHSTLAQSLIEYVNGHELVDELLAVGREIRPELGWPGSQEAG